ncbi:hypothetical protein C440_07212 [Haloferax mucosum ATCC BAA-1512]|uniref:Uncharacterized protein n=1 Tax=Haloferax mucosum ATCC BAA-1512 TaxID=662479 RepID=M0IDI6_9EURY|nr:hypothetical protein C440_07212 [Haloferax mucosum ATCC BAA-1512]
MEYFSSDRIGFNYEPFGVSPSTDAWFVVLIFVQTSSELSGGLGAVLEFTSLFLLWTFRGTSPGASL